MVTRRPARQLQGCHGACVTDHGAAHELAQIVDVGRLTRLARQHVGGTELCLRLEDAWFQQRQQIVKLDQVVLHRRRRQQQQKALVQGIDELPSRAGAIAQMVGLVDHHDDQAGAGPAPPCARAARAVAIEAMMRG